MHKYSQTQMKGEQRQYPQTSYAKPLVTYAARSHASS